MTRTPGTKTLTVRTLEQAALWLELDGQISDGAWENATPRRHWEVWCDAEVRVASDFCVCGHPHYSHEHGIGPNGKWCGKIDCKCHGFEDAPVGRDFYAMKDNYDFTRRDLLEVVEKRMLSIVRIARALGLEAASELEHAPSCDDGSIDWSFSFNQEHAKKIAEARGINSIQVKNLVDVAIADETYGRREMMWDLNDLKAIVKTRRRRRCSAGRGTR